MSDRKPLVLFTLLALCLFLLLAASAGRSFASTADWQPEALTATPSALPRLEATLPFYLPMLHKPTDAPLWLSPTATPSGEGASDIAVLIVNIYWSGTPAKNQSDEYIEIFNSGDTAYDLGGWSLYSDDTFTEVFFPEDFALAPHRFCRVYTNEIHPDSCAGVSFDSTQEVWPDDFGCGGLYTPKPDEYNMAYYCY